MVWNIEGVEMEDVIKEIKRRKEKKGIEEKERRKKGWKENSKCGKK